MAVKEAPVDMEAVLAADATEAQAKSLADAFGNDSIKMAKTILELRNKSVLCEAEFVEERNAGTLVFGKVVFSVNNRPLVSVTAHVHERDMENGKPTRLYFDTNQQGQGYMVGAGRSKELADKKNDSEAAEKRFVKLAAYLDKKGTDWTESPIVSVEDPQLRDMLVKDYGAWGMRR